MSRYLGQTRNAKTAFEPYRGLRPSILLHEHPDGRLMALLAEDATSGTEHAGVWDAHSGQFVWTADDAVLLAWADRGSQVLVLRAIYQPDPQRSPLLASPLQSEFKHVLERRAWPERQLLGSCHIQLPSGWASELAAAPNGNLATVTWIEQDSAGIVLARWGDDQGDVQIQGVGPHGKGYFVASNLIQGPVFSADGRYAVAACSLWSWWAPGGNPGSRSPGGRIKAGHLAILDTATLNFVERDVVTEVPAGWNPNDYGSEELMGYPEFTDLRSFQIQLPTGRIERFDLP